MLKQHNMISRVWDQQTMVWDQQTMVWDQQTMVWDQQTMVCDQQTMVWDQQTMVWDQQTMVCDQQTDKRNLMFAVNQHPYRYHHVRVWCLRWRWGWLNHSWVEKRRTSYTWYNIIPGWPNKHMNYGIVVLTVSFVAIIVVVPGVLCPI